MPSHPAIRLFILFPSAIKCNSILMGNREQRISFFAVQISILPTSAIKKQVSTAWNQGGRMPAIGRLHRIKQWGKRGANATGDSLGLPEVPKTLFWARELSFRSFGSFWSFFPSTTQTTKTMLAARWRRLRGSGPGFVRHCATSFSGINRPP